jgi:hypothetical protein
MTVYTTGKVDAIFQSGNEITSPERVHRMIINAIFDTDDKFSLSEEIILFIFLCLSCFAIKKAAQKECPLIVSTFLLLSEQPL